MAVQSAKSVLLSVHLTTKFNSMTVLGTSAKFPSDKNAITIHTNVTTSQDAWPNVVEFSNLLLRSLPMKKCPNAFQ